MSTLSGNYTNLSDERGQSEVLGFILIFSIMIAGALVIVGLGATTLGDTEDGLSDDRAEKALTQFDSKAGLVALGEADSQDVSFAAGAAGKLDLNEDDGWMAVTKENRTSEYSEEVMNVTLGSLSYTNDGSRMAYQGGGVWRADESGGAMISPPEFHYRNGTLTLPAVTVTGDPSPGSDVTVERGETNRAFPNSTVENRTNPLDEHRVDVTVQSEYYRGWGEYFSERTDGDVEYDHDRNRVTVTLVSPVNINEVTAASASLAAGGEFNVSGNALSDCADDVFTDSYDSSTGETYCEQYEENDEPPAWNGDVVYGKDIDISDGTGGTDFYGDIVSGQTVTVDDSQGQGQPDVYGNISYADKCISDREEGEEQCEDRIASADGEVNQIDGVDTANSVDWYIQTVVDEVSGTADETNPAIEGERLEAGEYYFDEITLGENETLELDTRDGDILLAVNESVTLEDDAVMDVIGEGEVQMFVLGDDVAGTNFKMNHEAKIRNDEDNATRFTVLGTADFDAKIGAGGGTDNLAKFTGVLYAPPGNHGTGSATIDGGEVFGGVLSGTTEIDRGSIHYDEALEGERVVSEDARIIRVTYLHVTENEIYISG